MCTDLRTPAHCTTHVIIYVLKEYGSKGTRYGLINSFYSIHSLTAFEKLRFILILFKSYFKTLSLIAFSNYKVKCN